MFLCPKPEVSKRVSKVPMIACRPRMDTDSPISAMIKPKRRRREIRELASLISSSVATEESHKDRRV